MEEIKKRQRSTNFSQNEKNCLINIIHKYKNVVANQKTDGVSVRQKEECWTNITNEFNASFPGENVRSKESLRRLYQNMVQSTRKTAANNRREYFKTGGGKKAVETKDDNMDLVLDIINKKTVDGLENIYDCDREEGEIENNNKKIKILDDSIIKPALSEKYVLSDGEESDVNYTQIEVDKDNLPSCSNPVEPTEVRRETTNKKPNEKNRKREYDARRRRPVISALTTSHISEKYNKLLDYRIEIAQLEIGRLTQQKLFEQQEQALKLKRLELEIKNLEQQNIF